MFLVRLPVDLSAHERISENKKEKKKQIEYREKITNFR